MSYRDHVTSEEVRNIVRHAIGPYEDLITTAKKTQIEIVWARNKINRTFKDDHTAHGTRREKERPRWEDNIFEWTGLGLGEALRKAEDREGWRKVVARLSLMPQQSFRPRDE